MLHILCCIIYVILLPLQARLKASIMNPFTTTYNPEHFCDRKTEIKTLRANIDNGLNTLVHSPRRLGKTALIRHLFHKLEKTRKYETVFVDLFATSGMEDLITALSVKILERYHKKNFFDGIKRILRGVSTSITIAEDGTPRLNLQLGESNKKTTLNQLLKYLEERKKKVVVTFDEFQEVTNYPEKAEAILRTMIQPLSNVIFIFSGSSNHLLSEMFFSAKRPFYQSAEVMVLGKINRNEYFDFINSTFKKYSKSAEPEAIEHILDFTENYTYYTQLILNHAFYRTEKTLIDDIVNQLISDYLESNKTDYQNLLNLLSENQRKLVISVAKEGIVAKPTAIEFIIKHKLPSISSVSQAIRTLTKKEVLYKTLDGFTVYDVFFKRFLQRYY